MREFMQRKSAFTMFLIVSGVLGIMLFSGCQNDGLHAVSGTVTLDGTPLAEGAIAFMPLGETGVSAGGQIKDGKYSTRVSPGKMVVKIYAERPLTAEEIREYNSNPMTGGGLSPAENQRKQLIPAEYNDRSKLNVDIQGNQKELDFQLESQ